MRNSAGQFVKGYTRPVAWIAKHKAAPWKAGAVHHAWKGDRVGYSGIHTWLVQTFGGASKCDNEKCAGKCKTFTWALRHGKPYARIRGNFVELCRSCHNLYDGVGRKSKTSSFPGVCWSNAQRLRKRWRATITINRAQKHLGFHATELEAHRAYQAYSKNVLWVK